MARRLTVVMPTKDREAILRSSVGAALEAIEGLDAELIVVNDAIGRPPNGLPDDPRLRVIENEGSGVAAARNTGARHSSGAVLLFVDDDVLTNSAAVRAAIAFHDVHPRATVNADWVYPAELLDTVSKSRFGRYLVRKGRTSLRGWFGDETRWRANELFEVDSNASYHLSIARSLFDEWGGYNGQIPRAGCEDLDLTRRGTLGRIGTRFFIDATVTVFHNELDKIEIAAYLARHHRTARNRRLAVQLGFTEQRVSVPGWKRALYRAVHHNREALLRAVEALPENVAGERLYSRSIDLVLGATILDGYDHGLAGAE